MNIFDAIIQHCRSCDSNVDIINYDNSIILLITGHKAFIIAALVIKKLSHNSYYLDVLRIHPDVKINLIYTEDVLTQFLTQLEDISNKPILINLSENFL